MQLGIVGLARSGKTTVFNAVTGGTAKVGQYTSKNQPNVGVVHVPDERVDKLAAIYRPKKTAYASIEYVDFPAGDDAFGKGRGPTGRFVNELARTDALIHVVRAFQDDAVPHPEGSIDPARDIATMDLELAFLDLGLIERRLDRLDSELRSLKPGERESLQRLRDLLGNIKEGLEAEIPVRAQQLSAEDIRLLEGSRFLTALPMLVIINVGDADLVRRAELEEEYAARFAGPGRRVAVLGGKLEMELNELGSDEAAEFREAAGVEESGMAHAIRAGYSLLGLISFLTVGPDECRAWSVRAGVSAPEAAGKIHTDLQRGFIRAEVMRYEDLIAAGSEAEVRRRGQLRTEGKSYVVQDGDVLHILFNV
jgi:hypothetical protein